MRGDPSLPAGQQGPARAAQAMLLHELDRTSQRQHKIKTTTQRGMEGGAWGAARAGAGHAGAARGALRSLTQGSQHTDEQRIVILCNTTLLRAHLDPAEHSPPPSSITTRQQAQALPCLTCTWPPAFVSAILLLSMGPGGSARGEQSHQKPSASTLPPDSAHSPG